MNQILSIIVPSYNAEATLGATLESVVRQDFQDWEVIIVNDGSTDRTEEIALKWVSKDSRFKYFFKQNEGLGKARNFGIDKSKGKFILPLDSDNLLIKDFAKDAIAVFEKKQDVGVVYGDAEYFGERNGLWKVPQYNFKKMLVDNFIDACAIYRKELWQKVGGYDVNMPFQGNEDWEFWLALGAIDVSFYHLNKITFKYFVSKTSMIRSFTSEMHYSNNDYIFKKYSNHYKKHYVDLWLLLEKKERDYFNKLKSKKFVIDLFLTTFFRFSIFGRYKKNN
ncbi:Glycosyl transferase family protein [Flavobacterium anhuiense]|uniref:Glycosyl transferase family protein n=1 Tax=Flavobacterium anhuiense TaxID=459526 RepID=A0A444VVV6_9FLAO|nr:glycosyltransferase family A protein [Flavobacterium anhuiense]RYJ37838.1 Glycosyl transferase family protein [Flavobacterium anhuiense]